MDKKKQPAKRESVGSGAGISGSKRAVEALRESERLYRSLTECSSDAIFCVNEKGQYKFANQLFASTFGKSPDYFIGKTFWDVYPKEHADYRFEATKRVFQTGQSESIEVEVPLPDKTLFFYATANPIKDETGKVILVLTHAVDITERKKTEEALRESESLYRLLSEHTTDTVWLMDMNLKITYHSPSVQKMRGFTAQEIIEIPTEQHVTPESFKLVSEVLVKELPRVEAEPDYNPVLTLELEYYCKDGTTIWTENKFSVIRDENCRPVSILGEARDITERRKAEQALQESEAGIRKKLNAILEPAGDISSLELSDILDYQSIQLLMDDFYSLTGIGVAIVDTQGKILVATGWQDICTRFHRVHPETQKHCLESDITLTSDVAPGQVKLYKCKNNMWDVATPIYLGENHIGNIFYGQFFFADEAPDYDLFRRQAGQYGFDEQAYIAALNRANRCDRDKIGHIMAFYARFAAMISTLSYSAIKLARSLAENDNTLAALKESQRQLSASLENAPDGIYMNDFEGNFLYGNRRCEEIIGYPREELIGKNFLELNILPESSLTRAAEILQDNINGKSTGPDELELISKDGRRVPVEINTSLVQRGGKKVVLAFVRDITERKKAGEALRESEGRFKSIIEHISDIFYMLDLNYKMLYISPQVERVLGYTLEEVTSNWQGYVTDNPINLAARDKTRLAITTGEKQGPYLQEFLHRDGTKRLIEINESPFKNDKGKVIGIVGAARDVTESKQTEEALRSKQIMLERTEGIAHLGSWEWDIATDTVTWSDELFRVFQRDPQEGAPSFADHPAIYHPDDFALLRQAVEAAIADGTPYALELRAIRKDGEPRVCMARGAAETAPGGRVVRLFGSLQDITGRKQAEEALRASEERFRNMSNLLPQAVFETDEKGNFTFVNRQGFEMFGYSEADIAAGMSVLEMIIPQDRDRAVENISQRIMGKDLPAHDYTAVRKDGRLFPAVIYASTIILNSKYAGMRGVLIDISDRKKAEDQLKESEEKYRMVVENAQEAIFIAVDGMIKFANGRAAVISGYSPEEITSMPFIDFIHPDDRQMVAERYIKWLNSEDVPTTDTVRFIFKPGNIIWGELNVVSITWEGRPAVLGFLTDVTDRKRLEEEQQRVAKLESVGLLAGGIAHDFNNILTSILGNISLASTEAAPGSELQNSLEQAEKASLRAKALTVQLLTFSKGGAPILKLASLTELLKDTAGFALSGSRVKCNFSIPSGLWHAEIDAGQISQVIHNLVINAQQAMPAGGSIEIRAENIALSEMQSLGRGLPIKSGDYVRIAVTDHGIGIPKDHLEKIFDPFFTTKQKGNGMGLAISFSIARQHDGHISVESELGIGSTFYLYLPASTKTITREHAGKEAIKPDAKARILVMDDEKGVREIAGRMLKNIGYKDIEFAEDGAEAIKMYKAAMGTGNPFTVAILDLTIAGGMGGEIAIQKLLKIDPGVKAIVSSGYIDDPVIAKYRDFGFSGMVAKPYTIAELRKAVQDVIG